MAHGSPVDIRQTLGANLRRLRKDAGLSQEELMWTSDVHRAQISKYERGETEPGAEVLARLARALGVSIERFFVSIGWQREPPRLLIESYSPVVDLEYRSDRETSAASEAY